MMSKEKKHFVNMFFVAKRQIVELTVQRIYFPVCLNYEVLF